LNVNDVLTSVDLTESLFALNLRVYKPRI
jgi:hypothetical protein